MKRNGEGKYIRKYLRLTNGSDLLKIGHDEFCLKFVGEDEAQM